MERIRARQLSGSLWAEELEDLMGDDESEEVNAEVCEDVTHPPVGVHGAVDDLGRDARQQQSCSQHCGLCLLFHLDTQEDTWSVILLPTVITWIIDPVTEPTQQKVRRRSRSQTPWITSLSSVFLLLLLLLLALHLLNWPNASLSISGIVSLWFVIQLLGGILLK